MKKRILQTQKSGSISHKLSEPLQNYYSGEIYFGFPEESCQGFTNPYFLTFNQIYLHGLKLKKQAVAFRVFRKKEALFFDGEMLETESYLELDSNCREEVNFMKFKIFETVYSASDVGGLELHIETKSVVETPQIHQQNFTISRGGRFQDLPGSLPVKAN